MITTSTDSDPILIKERIVVCEPSNGNTRLDGVLVLQCA